MIHEISYKSIDDGSQTTHNITLRLRSTVRAITRATASDDDLVSIQGDNLTTFNKAQHFCLNRLVKKLKPRCNFLKRKHYQITC